MSVPIIFNELSISQVGSKHEANRILENFVVLLISLARAGTQKILRVQEDFMTSKIFGEYSIYDWCNNSEIDKETRLYLRRTGTEHPVVKVGEAHEQEFREQDFFYSNRQAYGLGAAYLSNGLCVSMNTLPTDWQEPSVWIDKKELLPSGNIECQTVSVRHASVDSHVGFHRKWLNERRYDKIQTGSDIWKYRSVLFSNLIFCTRIESILNKIGPNHEWFSHLKEILILLNTHTNELKTCLQMNQIGTFELTDESTETKNHPKCGSAHAFTCPDGTCRDFFWHVKGPDILRIYIHYQEPFVFVGHVGHLPISSSPNFYR